MYGRKTHVARTRMTTDDTLELHLRESLRKTSLQFLLSEAPESGEASGGDEGSDAGFQESANSLFKHYKKFANEIKSATSESGEPLFPKTSAALEAASSKLMDSLKNKSKSSGAFTALALLMGASAMLMAKTSKESSGVDSTVGEAVDDYEAFASKNFKCTKKWWDYTRAVIEGHVASLSEQYGYRDEILAEGDPELIREFQFLKRLGRFVKGKIQSLFQGKDVPAPASTINTINAFFGTDFSENYHAEIAAAEVKDFASFFNTVKPTLALVSVSTPEAPASPGGGGPGGGGEEGSGGREGGRDSGGGGERRRGDGGEGGRRGEDSGGGDSGGGSGDAGGGSGGGKGDGGGGEGEEDLTYLDDLTGKELKAIKKMGGPKATKFVDSVLGSKEDLRKSLEVESNHRRNWVKFLFEEEGAAPTPEKSAGGDEDPTKKIKDLARQNFAAGEDKLGKGNDITPEEAEKIADIIKKSAGGRKEMAAELEKLRGEAATLRADLEKAKDFKNSDEYKKILTNLSSELGIDESAADELLTNPAKLKAFKGDPEQLDALRAAQEQLKNDLETARSEKTAAEKRAAEAEAKAKEVQAALDTEKGKTFKDSTEYEGIRSSLQATLTTLSDDEIDAILSDPEALKKKLEELKNDPEKVKEIAQAQKDLRDALEKVGALEKQVSDLTTNLKTVSDELEGAKADALTKTEEYGKLKDLLGKNEEQIKSLLADKGAFEKEVAELRGKSKEDAEKLETVLADLAKAAEDLKTAKSEASDAKAAAKALKSEVEQFKSKKEELEAILKKSEEERNNAEVEFQKQIFDLTAKLTNLEVDKNKEIADIIDLAKKVHHRADAKGNMTADELIKFLELVGDPLKAEKIVAADPAAAENLSAVADAAGEIAKGDDSKSVSESLILGRTSLYEAMFNDRKRIKRVNPESYRRRSFLAEQSRRPVSQGSDDVILERWQRLAGLIK